MSPLLLVEDNRVSTVEFARSAFHTDSVHTESTTVD